MALAALHVETRRNSESFGRVARLSHCVDHWTRDPCPMFARGEIDGQIAALQQDGTVGWRAVDGTPYASPMHPSNRACLRARSGNVWSTLRSTGDQNAFAQWLQLEILEPATVSETSGNRKAESKAHDDANR